MVFLWFFTSPFLKKRRREDDAVSFAEAAAELKVPPMSAAQVVALDLRGSWKLESWQRSHDKCGWNIYIVVMDSTPYHGYHENGGLMGFNGIIHRSEIL